MDTLEKLVLKDGTQLVVQVSRTELAKLVLDVMRKAAQMALCPHFRYRGESVTISLYTHSQDRDMTWNYSKRQTW